MDIAWDDQIYVTGSFGTGSVETTSYPQRFTGSISPGVVINKKIAFGNISGNAYLNITSNGIINSGSVVFANGNSETINGLS